MNMNNFTAVATEVWLNTIIQQADTLLIEDVWLLQGDFYQGFANALFIGSKLHECTKTELLLLDKVPLLLCSLTALTLKHRDLSIIEFQALLHRQICLILTNNNTVR